MRPALVFLIIATLCIFVVLLARFAPSCAPDAPDGWRVGHMLTAGCNQRGR